VLACGPFSPASSKKLTFVPTFKLQERLLENTALVEINLSTVITCQESAAFV
jgi:hypothetical protein